MLVACRLAGLSALEGHYAGVRVRAQCGPARGCAACFFWVSADGAEPDLGQLNVQSGTKIKDWHAKAGLATTALLRFGQPYRRVRVLDRGTGP